MTVEELLREFGKDSVKQIRENIQRAGKNATGKTSRMIGYESNKTKVTVFGPAWVFTLETGRGPYKGGPPANLKGKIAEWMRAKGVNPRGKQTIEQAAKGIAWFINKHGTELYRQGGRKDILTPVQDSSRIDTLFDKIAKATQEKTLKEIDKVI